MDELQRHRVQLPAATSVLADPQHPEYLPDPDEEHLFRSAAALEELADEISQHQQTSPTVHVELHHIVNAFATPLLYIVPLESISPSGDITDPFVDRVALHVVVIANQPVELQMESTLAFFAQLINRQRKIQDLRRNDQTLANIDLDTTTADYAGEAEAVDSLRYGWRATAKMVARKAEQHELGLAVGYDPAFAYSAHDLKPRLRMLRRVYNEMEDVRHVIDRMVTSIAGRQSRVAGGPEHVRTSLQQHGGLLSLSQYFAQAVRDALVVGNGYVTFAQDEPVGAYNLRPDDAEPPHRVHSSRNRSRSDSSSLVHFKGFEQPQSAVGLGICELMLRDLHMNDTFREAIAAMQPFVRTRTEARDAVREYSQLQQRHERQRKERVSSLFGWWIEHSPAPTSNLYVEGQERL